MKRWWIGASLLAVGLGWCITDWVLRTLYPLSWGGPNIGGGGLLLIAVGAAITGAVMLMTSGRALLSRPKSWVLWAPVAVDAALLVGLVAVRVLLPGDTGPDGGLAGINGQVGVTVDATGAPVLMLEVCHGSVDTVTVVGPNRGSQPNEVFARLTAPAPVASPTQVALLAPPPGWSGTPTSLPLDTQSFLIASAEGTQSELRQVDFSAADLATLDPETVQYSDYDDAAQDLVNRRTPRSGFHQVACAN
ncbi:hypothetical protein [Modestobacter italicus]|uniref:hypothetical protein n=1 Tax=Modestobacter italicus (strain DSM 44449 / CECT 9708 / BC 501) TaxID=2732864 RepID=UPI0005A2523F|nr:hypothetical protein [Modestobacter marinus]